MNIISTQHTKPAQTCYVAVRIGDDGIEPVIYGVYLDKQQALLNALLAENREGSDMIRNLSTYGAVQTVLIYPLGDAE